MKRINPRIIYASLTSYGTRGPDADRPGYDLIVQALSGILGHRRLLDGTPMGAGVWVADCSAPMLLAYGITLALLVRERTGEGQKVETSLLNLAIAMQSVDLVSGEMDSTPPRSYATQALYAPYKCLDGEWLIIVVVNDTQWYRLCVVLGLQHLATDPWFGDTVKRAEHSVELFDILDGIFSTKPRAEWLSLLQAEDVPCAPILTRQEVFTHPQVLANEMIIEVEHPTVGKSRMMGVPLSLSGGPGKVRRPAPTLGQHTEEVLRELGYNDSDISRLQESGIIK